jgi:hypothetical protein
MGSGGAPPEDRHIVLPVPETVRVSNHGDVFNLIEILELGIRSDLAHRELSMKNLLPFRFGFEEQRSDRHGAQVDITRRMGHPPRLKVVEHHRHSASDLGSFVGASRGQVKAAPRSAFDDVSIRDDRGHRCVTVRREGEKESGAGTYSALSEIALQTNRAIGELLACGVCGFMTSIPSG